MNVIHAQEIILCITVPSSDSCHSRISAGVQHITG